MRDHQSPKILCFMHRITISVFEIQFDTSILPGMPEAVNDYPGRAHYINAERGSQQPHTATTGILLIVSGPTFTVQKTGDFIGPCLFVHLFQNFYIFRIL